MSLDSLSEVLLLAVEKELKKQIARLEEPRYLGFENMLTFHMGWTGELAGNEAQGKRIRPLLTLLVSAACGADWAGSLPAAAALELVHNFSLVHDDIQDNSPTRRGRPTVWKEWGVAQGINAGDALFVLANLAVLDLADTHPAGRVIEAAGILQKACLDLTRGQYLDIDYESSSNLVLEDYWPMIAGKTAALLTASSEIGALLGGAGEDSRTAYRDFGHYLGLAFQIQDDLLGIWGNETLVGKSTASDLVAGKKSLPVLFGLGKKGRFAKRWEKGPITPADVAEVAELLASEGARLYAQETADQMTDLAMNALHIADPAGDAGEALFELAHKLCAREK